MGKNAVSPALAGIVIVIVVVGAVIIGMKMMSGNKPTVTEEMRQKYGATGGMKMDPSKAPQPGYRPPTR